MITRRVVGVPRQCILMARFSRSVQLITSFVRYWFCESVIAFWFVVFPDKLVNWTFLIIIKLTANKRERMSKREAVSIPSGPPGLLYARFDTDFFPRPFLEQTTNLRECEVYQDTLPWFWFHVRLKIRLQDITVFITIQSFFFQRRNSPQWARASSL
jgi:hypothetical protein